MSYPNFSSPHCHLQSLDTGSTIEDFIEREKELGTGTITCTDHGYLGACREVYDLARKNNLKPILGIEGYHRDDNCQILTKHGIKKDNDGTFKTAYKYGHITIHALDQPAYQKIVKLVSDRDLTAEQHGSERKPIFTWEDLADLGQYNITATSGCFIKGTLVKTTKGLKEIQDIQSGDFVYDKDGFERKVNIATTREFKGKLYKLKIQNTIGEIVCTENHEFLVQRGFYDSQWVRADALEAGNHLQISIEKRPDLLNNTFSHTYKNKTTGQETTITFDLSDPDTLWALGLFVAEGSFGGKNPDKEGKDSPNSINIALHRNKDAEHVTRFSNWAIKSGATSVSLYKRKISAAYPNPQGIEINVFSRALTETFLSLFEGRTNAEIKHIPDCIKNLHPNLLRDFIKGYMDGDGSVFYKSINHKNTGKYNARILNMTTISRQLADDLLSILRRADLVVNPFIQKAKKSKDGVNHKEAYYLNQSGENAEAILRWVNKQVIYINNSKSFSYLRSIESFEYTGPVYCLNVETEPNFSLASGVVVHNCLIGIIGRHVKEGNFEIALDYYNKLRSLIKPDNFYVELFTHKCDKNWVSGVFVELKNGKTLQYYFGKKLKTEEFEEISAIDLAKVVLKGKNPGRLIAIKNYRVWESIEPVEIQTCKIVRDFIPNECSPWCPDGDIQASVNKFLYQVAQKNGDPILLSDDAHYAQKADRVVQEAKLGGMGDSFRFYGSYHRYSSEEAFKHFQETMGMSERDFEELLDNNARWASRFNDFKLTNPTSLPTSFYPKDTLNHLFTLIDKHGRMNWNNQEMKDRLNDEINLLKENGTIDLLPYFFLGEEVPTMYIENGELPGPGRGSAAGLLISYLLGITHINPLQYKLSKDRFLTLDRIQSNKMPDIDQDLPNRDLLIPWLEKRFGPNVAQVSTRQLLKIKSGIKDVARAEWGNVPDEIEALCKNIPNTPQGIEDKDFLFGYTGEDGKEVKGIFEGHLGLQAYAKKYPKQWEVVLKILGIVRAHSRHASAYIIADKPIDQIVPLMTINGTRATQYTATSCEASGLLKMDYLCLNTLIDLQNAIKIIQERSGININDNETINDIKVPKIFIIPHKGKLLDIYNLPLDQSVFHTICEGETETVFQLNTSSAVKWLNEFNYWKDRKEKRKSIDSIEGVATFTALDRPGPLDAVVSGDGQTRNMLQEYAARARKEKAYGSIQFLDEGLAETFGVMVFQEQLQKIYQDLTGCSGIEANKFRNDIGKKEMAKVIERYPFFIENASKVIGEEQAKQVWEQIFVFGQYGFNLAHATSYAVLAYACAYLKHHFSLEWWCAVLRNADKNEIGEKFWKYCKSFVQLPDIQYSEDKFDIKNGKIVAPLSILHGVGEGAHLELSENKPFTSIDDFCKKIVTQKIKKTKTSEDGNTRMGVSALNRGVVSKLIVSGVLDSLFEYGTTDVVTKLELFEEKLALALNKKKPEKIKEEYRNLTSLQIFQHKKSVLPIYSEFLLPYLVDKGVEGITKKQVKFGEEVLDTHSYKPQNPETISYINKSMGVKDFTGPLAFVDGDLLRYMNEDAIIDPDNPLHVATACYVLDCRKFSFRGKRDNKMHQACEFVLDVNGEIIKSVKWSTKKTDELVLPEGELKGAIVLALLSRWSNDRGFSIESIIKVQEPLEN